MTNSFPSQEAIQSVLAAEIEFYRESQARVALLSLLDVCVATRLVFPGAAFIAVSESDQDFTGSLVASEEDVLDAEYEPLTTDDPNEALAWVDRVMGPLSNLNRDTVTTWQPFIVQNENGGDWKLDIGAVERAVPDVIAALAR